MKLNLGYNGKQEGWTTVDIQKDADVYMDLTRTPWGFENVEQIRTDHFLQEVRHHEAQNILNECYRILIPGGKLTVNVPDINKYIKAYTDNDGTFFLNRGVTHEQRFLYHLMWGGASISFYGPSLMDLMLRKAGFTNIKEVTPTSRVRESLEMEAIK